MKLVSRPGKIGDEFVGACLRGVFDWVAILCDNRGGGVDRGFCSAPFQVEGFVPSCLICVPNIHRPVLGTPKW